MEKALTAPTAPTASKPVINKEFYRRELPSTCISFGSPQGKIIFGEALASGFMNCYFPLAAQFRTQEEPAFCGLTTLVMVLNALAVDPGRVWKGPWRWYHENMLDCCVPLTKIEKQGITLEQFNCLAACNALNVQTIRPDPSSSSSSSSSSDLDKFRDFVKMMCRREDAFVVCSYSRRVLRQTGDGHFAPIGGYHPGEDLVLILDTARFKYPPHWVPLTTLWEAMLAIDKETGLNRGFSIVQRLDSLFKADSQLMFKPSEYFSVNAPARHRASVRRFVHGFESWAADCVSPIGPSVVEEATEQLLRLIEEAEDDDFHLLTTRGDGLSCANSKTPVTIPLQNSCLMSDLMSAIKSLPIYDIVHETLERMSGVDDDNDGGGVFGGVGGVGAASIKAASAKAAPTRLAFGRTRAATAIACDSADCGATTANVTDVGEAEFATMFLLAWPFGGGGEGSGAGNCGGEGGAPSSNLCSSSSSSSPNPCPSSSSSSSSSSSTTNNLRAYVKGSLEMPLPPILQQEVAMLRHQLRQIKTMFAE